jgi:ATP-binding cassette subfamily F protein uup
LLLARIFKRPTNVMVLDEPTNDLDAETLELLEELVTNYDGTLLIVSHDRAFLNNVVTSTLVFEEDGVVREYDGGYDDYVRQSTQALSGNSGSQSKTNSKKTATEKAAGWKTTANLHAKKLTYKERLELEKLPDEIAELESEQQRIHDVMADPDFFKQEGTAISDLTVKLEEIERKLEVLMGRWEKLESRI